MKVDGIEVPDALVVAETRRLVLALGQRLPSENLARHADRIRDQARQLALGRHLLLEEAVRQGIEISPAEVEEDLDRVRRACGTPKAFEEHLRRLEATPESLRQTLAEARQVDELTRRLTADIPEPSESELQAFYDEHAGDFAEPERARVRHILIRTDPKDQAGRPTALARIRALFDQLASGLASFEDLAREHSDCPSGRETGGDLGWIRRGQMPGPFEDAALSLEPGAVSQPVINVGLALVAASALRCRTVRRAPACDYVSKIAPLGQGPVDPRGPRSHVRRIGLPRHTDHVESSDGVR